MAPPPAPRAARPATRAPHDHGRCVADALEAADALCRQRNVRFTPLRRRVFELVWSSHKPVGAYALLDGLQKEGFGSAPPTVYRALDFLLEQGLAHRIESLNAFVGCSHPGETHRGFFLICRGCGEADELDDDGLAQSIGRSARSRGFEARDMTLEVAGLCSSCAGRA